MSPQEQQLCQLLSDLPRKHKNHYTPAAERALLEGLFWSLARGQYDNMRLLFPRGPPTKDTEKWALREAQGAVEGAEYSAAARGKPCGHIFKSGEATYRCKTCTVDDTCVLCCKCFESSDHSGHMVFVNISPGNSGCCDCGDPEAWKIPVKCAIHTELPGQLKDGSGKAREPPPLPDDLLEGIRMTIGRAIDYLCDVISCSPEQLRLPKTEGSVRDDERTSRLTPTYYLGGDESEANPEFALILWNDEKHTVTEVQDQVARACKRSRNFGKEKANETHDIGRSIVQHSADVGELLRVSKIIEQIKVTVTIRSARDTFREQMCGTIIEWLGDIAGCSVGSDHNVLRQTICEEVLKPWRTGSGASNAEIGRNGIDDHEKEDSTAQRRLEEVQTAIFAQMLEAERNGGNGGNNNPDLNDNDDDDMDLDILMPPTDDDGDVEMRTADDETEVLEATFAGYPPPPPPPPIVARRRGLDALAASTAGPGAIVVPRNAYGRAFTSFKIPRTPGNKYQPGHPLLPPKHWIEKPAGYVAIGWVPQYENHWQRVRLDWLILFDLRMWKKARIDLRDLYISTVVAIPQFKRILGLRFAGLYTTLAQLYLIADREPDHSIINLSLQMLTTPSITEEVVERENFLTNLIAILYTFLTTRQVGHPHEVNPTATLAFDAGSLTNRRMYHFFMDMRYLFGSEQVQEKLRREERYMLQFLDLVKLGQGICPNVRAIGDHVEYETDAWISASLITRELNRLVRQFAESFKWRGGEESSAVFRAIRCAAKAAIRSSIGVERRRFSQSEVREEVKFKDLGGFEFDVDRGGEMNSYKVVKFVVEKKPISFHHALHYTLSWLIDSGKSMSQLQLTDLLRSAAREVRMDPVAMMDISSTKNLRDDDMLFAMYDFPLRVCAWLAQMKAVMWVRNGLSLRHQWQTYRGISQRDVTHNRDIFLMQAAVVSCEPSRILASMIDRYGMDDWMKGNYEVRTGYDEGQVIDVAEEFIHFMIILLSDRISLLPIEEEPRPQILAMKRDIAHVLCFKPLSFSELCGRIADKFQEQEEFQEILEAMTTYRPPEGLSDSGTFELKPEFLEEIDPYIAHYSKNQREESESAYRTRMSKLAGKPASEIVFEPKLRPIRKGAFTNLAAFTRTRLFAQVIYYSLKYPLVAKSLHTIPDSRLEAFLQVVLHLTLLAIAEDNTEEADDQRDVPSFANFAINIASRKGEEDVRSTVLVLQRLSTLEEYKACHPKIDLILKRLRAKRPIAFTSVIGPQTEKMECDTPVNSGEELERKKRLALERQAKVMAQFQQQQQNFLNNQDMNDWPDDDDDDVADTLSLSGSRAEEQRKVWKYPTGTCILCQEETNDAKLYGTFALITDSNVLRQTDLKDSDYIMEVASTPTSLDRSAEEIRPFGVAGKNKEVVRKLDSNGTLVTSERQGLGKGFPPAQVRRGLVSTGCGHMMHYSCFEVYYQTTQRRQAHQIARNHPERTARGEFVCPLCKALGNAFLPVIWRGKEESYPNVVQTQPQFDKWLVTQIGPVVTGSEKAPEGGSGQSKSIVQYQHTFISYGSKTIIPPIATKFEHLVKPSAHGSLQPTSPAGAQQGPSFLSVEALLHQQSGAQASPGEPLITELVNTYKRLRDTIKSNRFPSRYDYPPGPLGSFEELTYCDTLARTLGFSVSAVEIAQRGVGSDPGSTLLDKISQQVLTHLRILSETVFSYISIGGLRGGGTNKTVAEFSDMHKRQLHQLFRGHPQIFPNPISAAESKQLEPLLTQDLFIFFTECATCLVPALEIDVHHILRLCYLAEIVKTVLSLFNEPGLIRRLQLPDEDYARLLSDQHRDTYTHEQIELFRSFVGWVIDQVDEGKVYMDFRSQHAKSEVTTEVLGFLRTLISRYALPFLRKSVILLHTCYGVDFPNTGLTDLDDNEVDRLTRALNLPSIDEIFESVVGHGEGSAVIQSIANGWARHWVWSYEGKRRAQHITGALSLSHPTIPELVGLPKNFDTLVEEAMKRRCPNTGKELGDPSVCLFCGDIFCSQALCCSRNDLGGCNQHLAKCGRDVGIFINIRKCMILYLHNHNGSWVVAPYLDKHGEVDPCLRRNRQLFLNQRRYDALLRSSWLQHGIPSIISRKMEADINNGGWETI
ncbi:hypothetical protein GP486_004303 [Trichoglossum hirsutum]|uniref:E3 ubiquitin-protein ligase n=1 Tax=Trichoglossum hirsutum TaxID=265104 RepID=A0A9P8LBF3_9PEZI|nr:hypothetical protein GP486_004303 [Trichoglossum hirsutum]